MTLPIHLYGLIIGIAIVAAVEVAERVAVEKGIDRNIIWKAGLWGIAGGVIGARAYHVIDYWSRWYSLHPTEIWYLWQGGLGIWGAIIGGAMGLCGYYFLKLKGTAKRVDLWELLDTAVIGLPLAQAIGRLGNWVNREVYGTATDLPWGIYIPETGKYHHPLFAYEAVLNLGLFIFLWKMRKNQGRPGKIIGAYLIGYGITRGLLENIRPAELVWQIGGVPTAILFSLLAILSGISLFSFRRR